ncbi:hypothetical protein [Mediterraneibacter gnavus]|uniref:hypothetical protein n=1 Tax=Mediterraneibacter gnavus TaxID=33038 RepID=UPI0022DFD32E|nr:hypothetical protein [Mediterraneibacter gnavus]
MAAFDLCLGRSLTTLPGKECPQTEQVEESETKDPDFEETQEPKKEEEPVVPAQTVPVPKTGDSWW